MIVECAKVVYLIYQLTTKTFFMQKKQDYRTHIKQLSKENLISVIDYYTNIVIERAGIMDFTRELKMLCYAKERLKKLNK